MKLTLHDVPHEAIQVLAKQMEEFGASVAFDSPSSGSLKSVAGKAVFYHNDGKLTVTITEDKGHFPGRMLIGGIRHMVEEAVELANRNRLAQQELAA